MAVVVIRGTNRKPVASQSLIDFFQANPTLSGELYIGYPILTAAEGKLPIDALLVSRSNGLVAFDLIEGTELSNHEDRQDDVLNKLDAKLRTHRQLVQRRALMIPLHSVSFGPALPAGLCSGDRNYPITNSETLYAGLSSLTWPDSAEEVYAQTLSVLQNISSIRQHRSRRSIANSESRGAKLKRLEDSIATLDAMQSRAVIETVGGVQRIRGLAGSGKTIVLALKAAYLHAQHPDWRIAVTFWTRSLKGQFRRLINTFSIAQTGEEPDWTQLRVLNAWGAPGGPLRDGIYYEFCKSHGATYFDFASARTVAGRADPFAHACRRALAERTHAKPLYDAILVDEAQDLGPEFLALCYEMLGPEKQLVYAYDELQSLTGRSLPPPEQIFGTDENQVPRVSLLDSVPAGARRDIVLDVCYRNSRPVLATAHALGFGVYRPAPKNFTTGLVSMFDDANLWTEVGYEVRTGALRPGEHVVLSRTPRSSPLFLENHSELEDLISFHHFDSQAEQNEWVVDQIRGNLSNDELRHDDILVINPDPLSTRKVTGPIRAKLLEIGIPSHLAGVSTDPDVFFMPDQQSVTFTGVFRAKGNEAGMVYVINAQDCCHSDWNLASLRNQLFTAITRSQAWVRILGVGPRMKRLIREFEGVFTHNFELDFKYPTDPERKHLSIVHRDVDPTQRKAIAAGQKTLSNLLEDLEKGSVHLEDLDPQLVNRLRSLVGGP
ncbi:MAG: ATP-binding domain-containing protein [Fimbriimonadales bacterium]